VKRLNLIILMLGLAVGNFALAQYDGAGTTRSKSSMNDGVNSVQDGWAGYLGAGAGYSGYNNNLNVEGAPTSLKILGSYVSPDATGVFDAGFGLQNQSFSQKAASDRDISTGVMELAARYQFENRWQLGGVYNQFFNKGVNYSANQADAEFGGVQILREFSFGGSYLGRVGGRVMTSLNVNNESVNMAIVDFQIGWGGSNRASSTASTY
jgi:OOP family OmpA-OmpF porin